MGQRDDTFDIGGAGEDSNGFLGGGDDGERLRGCGEGEGVGLTRELEGNAMEGGMERWVRIGKRGEEGIGWGRREDDGLGYHGSQSSLH